MELDEIKYLYLLYTTIMVLFFQFLLESKKRNLGFRIDKKTKS
jgi:hypothetical protein